MTAVAVLRSNFSSVARLPVRGPAMTRPPRLVVCPSVTFHTRTDRRSCRERSETICDNPMTRSATLIHRDGRRFVIDSEQIREARHTLGRRLAHYRQAAGYNQHQFAPHTLYGRSTIANVEVGRQNVSRDFWQRCDQALQTGDTLLRGYDELVALVAQRSREIAASKLASHFGNPVASGTVTAETDDFVESPLEIFNRLRHHKEPRVTDSLLDALDASIADVSDRYEETGPVVLAPAVVRQRRWIEHLLAAKDHGRQQQRLCRIAGQLSSQLSYMAVNLGRFRSAQAYSAEAFQLADMGDDDDLRAWVRGTESLAAYYNGDYGRALAIAQDGQRYAKNGRQAVRLAINGEARALSQLGDRRGAEEAVGRAYEIASRFPTEASMTPCISFGIYSEARTASNAATAFLALGDTARVLDHTARAGQVVDASPSIWSRALVRLDTAAALVRAKQPDLERATLLGHEAMDIAGIHRLESIQQRTRALAVGLRRWRELPSVSDFLYETHHWLSRDWKRST